MADPKPFSEIAAGFPKNLPADQYDAARKQYFDEVIIPRLDRGSSQSAARKQFMENTERPLTLGGVGKAVLPVAQFAAGFTHALTKPLATVTKSKGLAQVSDLSERAEKSLGTTASREGRSNVPIALGEMGGAVAPIALASETGGLALEEAGMQVGSTAYKLLRGGLAFGTFEAASADEGNRLTAGVKGFGVGVAFEGVLGVGGKLLKRGVPQKEIDSIVTKVLSGEGDVSPEINNDITQSIKNDVKVSREEGRPEFIKEDPNYKGVGVLLHDAENKPITLKVRSGNEHAVVKQVLDITNAGGVVDGIIHHPNDVGLANRFMRASADSGAQKYEGAKILRTSEGHAPSIALENSLDGKETVATGSSEVVTQTPQRVTPAGIEIERGVAQLRDEDGYELSRGAQGSITKDIKRLWRNDVPDANKRVAADRLKSWELGDLIPQQWRMEKPLPEGIEKEPTSEDILQRTGGEDSVTRTSDGDKLYESKVRKGRAMKQYAARKAAEAAGEPTSEDIVARAKELGVSEIELNRLQEIHEREPGRVGEQRFEDIGKTADVQAVHNILIPESEDHFLSYGPDGVETIPHQEGANVGMTPRRFAIQTGRRTIQGAVPGAAAITHPPAELNTILERLGLPKQAVENESILPGIVYEGTPHRAYAYHEGLHVDAYHVFGGKEIITDGGNVADEIGRGLSKFASYKHLPDELMREEGFVHAATAIRMGDAHYLSELVRMDGSVDDVFKMVHDRATALLGASRATIDSAPARVLQRKMEDLVVRTTNSKTWELMDQTSKILGDSWYDPEIRSWKLKSIGQLAEETYDSYKSLVDELDKRASGEQWAPSASLFGEARGVRGPITPRGSGPVKDPVAMDTPPDVKWGGWTSISGWMRPMGPWVNDLHVRVNDALSSSGKRLPIYDRWKDVDDAFVKGSDWLNHKYDSAAQLLDGLGKKQYDYFNVLTTDPTHWPEMARQLNLDQGDLNKIKEIDNWLGDFRDETGILVKNYLRDELPRLRNFDYSMEHVYGNTVKTPAQMSTFERLITQGKLDPRATHVGSFMDTVMREGFSQKFTDKPLRELEKLVELKAKDGSYVLGNMRHPLVNYTRYMRGIPDVTGQIMNKSVKDFTEFLGRKAEQMNKHLPSYAQLPTKMAYPQSIINKMMVWSYAAGLGLRASIPIRDTLQVFSTGLPVLGPARFARGLARGLTKDGWKFAEESGALLQNRNIGDVYGDIFNELPPGASTDRITKFANMLLAPSRWGHNPARSIVFNGEYESALEGVNLYRQGKISADELISNKHTSLWFNDKPVQERILGQLADSGFTSEEVARNIASETLDLTLWPYRRGMQPTALRTGMGRIFGQFGMWPMNYLDFMRRASTKFAEHPQAALQMSAMWAASNYAAVSAMNGIGADAGKWFWFSPAGIDMSPHAKFVMDLGMMAKETPDGREARRRVLEYPLTFFPTSNEAENVWKVIESGDQPFDSNGHPTPALLQVLGFKPLKEAPERDLEQQIEFESGFSQKRGPQ